MSRIEAMVTEASVAAARIQARYMVQRLMKQADTFEGSDPAYSKGYKDSLVHMAKGICEELKLHDYSGPTCTYCGAE